MPIKLEFGWWIYTEPTTEIRGIGKTPKEAYCHFFKNQRIMNKWQKLFNNLPVESYVEIWRFFPRQASDVIQVYVKQDGYHMQTPFSSMLTHFKNIGDMMPFLKMLIIDTRTWVSAIAPQNDESIPF